ncbi:hypothetical protein TEQUI_0335 [Taylorella equigenitalis MCE9]|uniref:Uncharacterized protein n=1 Tax=Taylorella equigenitalis (strain MCE9) TaxID=937774 RepID=A0A654KFT7_TAYEM|nr:hypothetical protein TEQUI_0335 [Taylorella equigenitalis MCE9]
MCVIKYLLGAPVKFKSQTSIDPNNIKSNLILTFKNLTGFTKFSTTSMPYI